MEEMTELLIRCVSEQGYEVSACSDQVLLRPDKGPWSWTYDRVAMSDGIYTRMEVGMGAYDLRKRVGCPDLRTAQILLLAWTCAEGDVPPALREALRECLPRLLEETADADRGQFILDSLRRYRQ